MLESGLDLDDALLAAWRARVGRAVAWLGWGPAVASARRHAGGVSLAVAAPGDYLFLATELNEWALCAALLERDPLRWSDLESQLAAQAEPTAQNPPAPAPLDAPVLEEAAAFARFRRLAAQEFRPRLRALLAQATTRGLPHVIDDAELTLGAGVGGRTFSLAALPDPADLDWMALRDIPTALVTGSNGKTTTVRLLAACARAHGWHTGYNSTDGVFLDDETLATGDYSGPAGARMVLREVRAQAAILETARGGILRRGLAVAQATVAVVTNVSADHFGEYGIDDLAGLAAVKLAVAAVVGRGGLLVLNADDPELRAQAPGLARRFGRALPVGWFAVDPARHAVPDGPQGASLCAVVDGRLRLSHRGAEHDLGLLSAMPLSMKGLATYNAANLAGAALAAAALGIAPATIAAVLARFGSDPNDNPGRMMRFDRGGVTILIDYAHNPDGLRGFLTVADHLRGTGRLAMLLGQAGNRRDAEIDALVEVAAAFHPDLVVVKENETQLRGRAAGDVPRIIRAGLMRRGLPHSAVVICNSELEAARHALGWARPGDLLALPLHSSTARQAVLAVLSPTFDEPTPIG